MVEILHFVQDDKRTSFASASKVFSVMAHAQKTQIPPNPPLSKGGTERNSFESPPLKKGDLGGFGNRQWEEIFGKRYKSPEIPAVSGEVFAKEDACYLSSNNA